MTETLKRAFEEISKLPEAEQDALASVLLEELSSSRKWDGLFSKSQDLLEQMAAQALAQHRRGQTTALDVLLGEDE